MDQWSGKLRYEPGDHVGVFAVNDSELVDGLINRLGANHPLPPDGALQLQILVEQGKANHRAGRLLHAQFTGTAPCLSRGSCSSRRTIHI